MVWNMGTLVLCVDPEGYADNAGSTDSIKGSGSGFRRRILQHLSGRKQRDVSSYIRGGAMDRAGYEFDAGKNCEGVHSSKVLL